MDVKNAFKFNQKLLDGFNMNRISSNIIDEIIAKMTDCGLGMRRTTVDLLKYDPRWAEAFSWLIGKFAYYHNGALDYRAEHFGSTSIPNLSAKPALDVMLIFKNEQKLRASVPFFEKLGFVYKGDVVGMVNQAESSPLRHFFSFYNPERSIDYVHLHVFVDGHPDIINNLRFRDILRQNQSLVKEYELLKSQFKAGALCRPDRINSKKIFISMVLSGLESP
jgi:GrpB-like predicted nucleotidyltransferase (UPF0157 family)